MNQPHRTQHDDAGGVAEETPQQHARRARFIRVFVIATWIMFLGMVSLLLYKWSIAREPTSVAIINVGRHQPMETTVIVKGLRSDVDYRVKVDPEIGSARFFLEPGIYTLQILQGPDEQLLFETDFTMVAKSGIQFDLTRQVAAATQPAADTSPPDTP